MDEFHKLKGGGSGGKPAWLNAKSAGSPLSRASGVTHEGDYGGIEQKGRNHDKVYARPELEHRKSGGRLTTKARNALPAKDFALPGRRYPVNDPSHARNALARVSQHGSPEEKAVVRRKVHAKYPEIGKK